MASSAVEELLTFCEVDELPKEVVLLVFQPWVLKQVLKRKAEIAQAVAVGDRPLTIVEASFKGFRIIETWKGAIDENAVDDGAGARDSDPAAGDRPDAAGDGEKLSLADHPPLVHQGQRDTEAS